MENKIYCGFNDSYCSLLESYSNAIAFLKDKDQKTYETFYKWYSDKGVACFEDIKDNIRRDKLDNRFKAFMDIYKSYLDDAMEEDSKQTLLDFLYIIPQRMKADFLKFGFLQDRHEFVQN